MSRATLADNLARIMGHDRAYTKVLRDWEDFLGRNLVPGDFQSSQVQNYLFALKENVADEDLERVRLSLVTIWQKAYMVGLISHPPDC